MSTAVVQLYCGFLLLVTFLHEVNSAEKVCPRSPVNVRSGPNFFGSDSIGILTIGNCLPVKEYSGKWVTVDYNGQDGWIYNDNEYLSVLSTSASDCPDIISRDKWDAKEPKRKFDWMTYTPLIINVYYFWDVSSPYDGSSIAKHLQHYHMQRKGLIDIGCTFVIDDDGIIYEGRGWNVTGGYPSRIDFDGYGICIAGNFPRHDPQGNQYTALIQLIQCGISKDHLSAGYYVMKWEIIPWTLEYLGDLQFSMLYTRG